VKIAPSGRRNAIRPRRSKPEEDPGSLFGEKLITCVRCGREFPASKLKTIPPNAGPDSPRIYVCGDYNQ